MCQRKACSGSKLLDLLVQTLLFYACCCTDKTGYYKSKLTSFTEDPGCHRLSLCMSFACRTAVSVCVCVEVKVKGQGEGQTLAIFLELVSKLLCCAYASYFTENKGLLTEQALLLSKESLFRQQASGPSCANALVLCLLLH